MANNITKVDNSQMDMLKSYGMTFTGIDLQTRPYDTITFPTLPTNFIMLMSKVEWPKKAWNNPNGSLFSDPIDIEKDKGNDYALRFFGSVDKEQLTGTISADVNKKVNATKSDIKDEVKQQIQDSYENIESNYNAVLERLIYEDTPNQVGVENKVPDIKSFNDKMTKSTANIVSKISSYIDESMGVINPVVQLVAGKDAGNAINKFNKIINGARQRHMKTVQLWIDNHDETTKDQNATKIKEYIDKQDFSAKGYRFAMSYSASKRPNGVDEELWKKSIGRLFSDIKGMGGNQYELNSIISRYSSFADFKEFDKYMDGAYKKSENKTGPIPDDRVKVPESLRDENKKKDESLEQIRKFKSLLTEAEYTDPNSQSVNFDMMYEDIFTTISAGMREVIGPREDWVCMKSLAEAMKGLKDRADKEIEEKIKIICKTNGQKSLKHWPFKAEGLLSMWNRYSSELNARMENRITQLTGVGGKGTGSADMVETFLTNTYPRIISVMTIYKLIFEQISAAYEKGIAPYMSLENCEEIIEGTTEAIDEMLRNLVSGVNNTIASNQQNQNP